MAAVSVIAPPNGPGVPAGGLWTAGPVPPGVTGPSRRAGAPACRPAAPFPALVSIALGPCSPVRRLPLIAFPAAVGGAALPPPASVSTTAAPLGAGPLACGLPDVSPVTVGVTGLPRGTRATAGAAPALPASVGATRSSCGAGTFTAGRAATGSPLAGATVRPRGPGSRAPGLKTTAPGPAGVTGPPRDARPGACGSALGLRTTRNITAWPRATRTATAGPRTVFGITARPRATRTATAGPRTALGITARPDGARTATAGPRAALGITARPDGARAPAAGLRAASPGSFGIIGPPRAPGTPADGRTSRLPAAVCVPALSRAARAAAAGLGAVPPCAFGDTSSLCTSGAPLRAARWASSLCARGPAGAVVSPLPSGRAVARCLPGGPGAAAGPTGRSLLATAAGCLPRHAGPSAINVLQLHHLYRGP